MLSECALVEKKKKAKWDNKKYPAYFKLKTSVI